MREPASTILLLICVLIQLLLLYLQWRNHRVFKFRSAMLEGVKTEHHLSLYREFMFEQYPYSEMVNSFRSISSFEEEYKEFVQDFNY
jgi:hypothetical protein